MTGLPWVDLDRRVEHVAGCSISQLVLERGRQHHERLESSVLSRQLEAKPCAVISLGPKALRAPVNAERVARDTVSVYLRRPIEGLARQIRRDLDQSPGRYPEFMTQRSVVTVDGIAPLLTELCSGYERATHTVDVDEESATTVARRLIRLLGIEAPTP